MRKAQSVSVAVCFKLHCKRRTGMHCLGGNTHTALWGWAVVPQHRQQPARAAVQGTLLRAGLASRSCRTGLHGKASAG